MERGVLKRQEQQLSEYIALREKAWDRYFFYCRELQYSETAKDDYRFEKLRDEQAENARYYDGIVNDILRNKIAFT